MAAAMSVPCFRVQCMRLLTDYSRLWLRNGRVCATERGISTTAILKKRKNPSFLDKEAKNDGATVDADMKSAVRAVAEALPGSTDRTQSELLQRLLSPASGTARQRGGKADSPEMSSILSSMKVRKGRDDEETGIQPGRPPTSKFSRGPSPENMKARLENLKLFSGPSLGIFTTKVDTSAPISEVTKGKSLWDEVAAEAIDQLALKPPENAFEEMIQLTKQGQLWTFPIDNEAGMTFEKNTGFHEHIFLESQIENFPKRGPIRHFMELVTVGLSKNPFLSVAQKHEHIEWFRNYFKNKAEVLEESLGKDGLMAPVTDKELQ